jgi:hypothetical protein
MFHICQVWQGWVRPRLSRFSVIDKNDRKVESHIHINRMQYKFESKFIVQASKQTSTPEKAICHYGTILK